MTYAQRHIRYPIWHHKYTAQGKQNQSRSREVEKGRGNWGNLNHGRIIASAISGSNNFTFTSDQFENLTRNVLKGIKLGATTRDCTNDELEFVAVDDYSRATWTYLMVHKSDALDVIKAFLKFVELQLENKVKCIRSDNALEFGKGPCALFLADKGIEHQTTCVDKPQ
ncbi:retrovirus-related pol polyprotein from transposon TNT 1-94 [Tanacetum coccineum]|uniref:Retrovirus-related pol polyprotein from transposon TNT 1-94 n=1 Tax=Tanacetum coccineum TaxID=301880 RepID=A0ABQ4YSL2_9ASTR